MRGAASRFGLLVALVALVIPQPGRAVPPGCADDSARPGGVHPGGEWRSYGHDYANTRSQPLETVITNLKVPTLAPAWTFDSIGVGGGGDFTGTPVIADGCMYVASTTGWVFAANADTGALVWKQEIPTESGLLTGGIFGSVAVADGKVFVANAKTGAPEVAALDQLTGAVVWGPVTVDSQAGSEVYTSPVFYDDNPSDSLPGMIYIGVSGGSAELGDEADRYAFQGNVVLLDSATGAIIKKIYTIPESQWGDGYAGGAVWGPTPAIDTATRYAYSGTGNPFQPQVQHPNTDAIIKIDLDRSRPTFGTVVGSYPGTLDEYLPAISELPCVPLNNPAVYPQGLGGCQDIDLDFGTSVNLFMRDGRTVVGAGQKSGVYHLADAETMEQVWTSVVGPPSQVGGVVGSPTYDGTRITGPITLAGYLWSIAAQDGLYRWFNAVGDGAHYGQPATHANGVVYTVDLKGFLDAYDAATGIPLLHRPMFLQSDTGLNPTLSFGGVAVARNTVYASVGISGRQQGYVIAFRPGGDGGGGLPEPPTLPDLPVGPVAVAVPGSASLTYATPVMIVSAGNPKLSFANFDVLRHDVTHDVPLAQRLFTSALIGTGETTDVDFHGNTLKSGTRYPFFCTIHPNMFGQLLAL